MGLPVRNLKILEKNTGVILKQNADKVVLRGDDDQATVKQALNIALQLLDLLEQGKGLHPAEVDQFSRMLVKEPDVDLGELIRETVFVGDRKRESIRAHFAKERIAMPSITKIWSLGWDLRVQGKHSWQWRWR